MRAVDGDQPANVKSVDQVEAASLPKKPGVDEVRMPPRPGWRSFFALDLLDNRHPALHGLRFLAVITVLQYHITTIFHFESGILLGPAWLSTSMTVFFGMDLFFFLSGFLIGAILLRSIEVAKTQNVGRFYLRRIFRTFPSYYIVLTFLALTTTLTPEQHHNLIYEYLYGTNYTSLRPGSVLMIWGWSLALEEQFYLTVPLFVFALNRLRSDRNRAILLVAIWASALVVRLWYHHTHHGISDLDLYNKVYFRTKTRFDPLVGGIMLAFIQHRWREPLGRWLSRPRNRALVALPTLTCFWVLMDPAMFGPQNMQIVHMFLWGTVTTMFYMGLVLLLLHGHGWIQDFLSAPIFRRVATLGYGVYLVHVPIVYHGIVPVARRLYYARTPIILLWPASLASLVLLSLGVGYILHIFVEKPSLRLRDRLTA